jgi:gluconate 2-dehydrogenase gamma chain
MKRRDLFKGALAGAGVLSAEAQTAAHAHTTPAAAKPVAAAWKPLLFDAHQNATVIVLSDLIIPATDTPGAKETRVNEYIDLILHDGAAERRARFVEGLGWIDGFAIRRHAKPFVGCTREQQNALLKQLDGATDPELLPGAAFFQLIKRLTVEGYYTSKAGIAELNKGGRVPKSFACSGHESH